MDEYNDKLGQTSQGELTASGGAGTAARMKEQISETAADVKGKVTTREQSLRPKVQRLMHRVSTC